MDPKINKVFTIIVIMLSSVSILFVYGCCFPFGQASQGSKSKYDPEIIVTYEGEYNEGGHILPQTRPFHMGFTPFPYDFAQDALEFTYANVNYHSDLVIHHFDSGIPWDEALENSDPEYFAFIAR